MTEQHVMLLALGVLVASIILSALLLTRVRLARRLTGTALPGGSARLKQAQRMAHIGSWEWDIVSDEVVWSDETYRIFGREPGDGDAAELFREAVHPDDRDAQRDAIWATVEGGPPYRPDHRIVLPDGRVRTVHEEAEVVHDDDGNAVRMVGIVLDVTDRSRVELALHEREDQSRAIVAALAEGLLIYDENGVIVEMNAEAERLFGISRSEAVGRSATNTQGGIGVTFLAATGEPAVYSELPSVRAFATGETQSNELLTVRNRNQDEFTLRVNAAPVMQRATDSPHLVVTTYVDVTAEVKADIARRQQEAELHSIIEMAPDPIIVIDAGGRIVRASAATSETFGWSPDELIGLEVGVLAGEEVAESHAGFVRHYVATGKPNAPDGLVIGRMQEVTGRRKDGTEIQLELSVAELPGDDGTHRFVGVLRDISERLEMHEQLVLAQKNEALATLVAGVAHDFNNLLTAIGGSVYMASEDPLGSKHWLANAKDATDRASGLVQQLLQYARRDEPKRGIVDAAETARQAINLARETFDRRIQLDLRTTPFGAHVGGDSTQLHQVLMNLIVNARDAVLERLEEATSAEPFDPRISVSVERRVDGRDSERLIEIVVEDNGTGMNRVTRERIFDPFFTTKPQGRGTGLGLATVYGIITEHGGTVTVHSEPGNGARFAVRLPAVSSGPTPAADGRDEEVALEDLTGTASVLLVDDEKHVLEFGGALLRKAGYHVTAAANGEEALRQLSFGTFDLIVLDVNMPALNGWQVLDELARDEQSPPVLVASGLAMREEALSHGAVGLISKPFDAATMLQAVQAATQNQNGAPTPGP